MSNKNEKRSYTHPIRIVTPYNRAVKGRGSDRPNGSKPQRLVRQVSGTLKRMVIGLLLATVFRRPGAKGR